VFISTLCACLTKCCRTRCSMPAGSDSFSLRAEFETALSVERLAELRAAITMRCNLTAYNHTDHLMLGMFCSVPAEFDSVSLRADVETELSADRLAELRAASLKRCVVANTLAKAGVTLDVVFTRKSAWMFKSSMGTYIP